ncbi:hypothetical protein DC366_17890 [Pelagivirga sediminicola]|uniref:Glycine zipper-like domain-containing protein n=1 Tax=Pelagivirga sediminicola TaxID=2170575 RepID=A0A2T7G2L4_9RHOB|nr:hypothetical protein DC366_17890 [Pelagivirga sediminicola]
MPHLLIVGIIHCSEPEVIIRLTGSSIAIGVALGAAIGLALDALVIGVSAGLILSILVGMIAKGRDTDDSIWY